uniref:Putative mitochondrial protein from fmp27 n=1 Tax=Anopheles darlingi TaxID=43151 RepID=A0A2M4DP71_ANODA
MMLQILYVLVLAGLIYLALAWILPKVIGYGLRKLYKIEINVGRFAFPLSLRDVTVCKSGYSVQIDEISLQSSFVNSDVSKLLSINVRDLRINKDIKKSPVVTGGAGTPTSGGPSSPRKGAASTPPASYGQSHDTGSTCHGNEWPGQRAENIGSSTKKARHKHPQTHTDKRHTYQQQRGGADEQRTGSGLVVACDRQGTASRWKLGAQHEIIARVGLTVRCPGQDTAQASGKFAKGRRPISVVSGRAQLWHCARWGAYRRWANVAGEAYVCNDHDKGNPARWAVRVH